MFILMLISIAVLFLLIIIGDRNSKVYIKPTIPKPNMVPPSQKPKSRI